MYGGRHAVVYTDGACFNNGFYGARAGVGVFWGMDHHLNTGAPAQGRQTNNSAEIEAATIAVQQATDMGLDSLTVITDSEFLINCQTRWVRNWQRYGWYTAEGRPVANRFELEKLDQVIGCSGLNVSFEFVRGHSGHTGNLMADALARDGANMH